MSSTDATRDFDRVRQAVLLGLFGGTGAGLGFLLFSVPGVELMTLNAALAGCALGPLLGAVAGGLSMAVFSLANPFGAPVPVLFAAQVGGMALAGVVGALAGPMIRRLPLPAGALAAALAGLLATVPLDLATNLAAVAAFDTPLVATLLAGLPVAAAHAGLNMLAFALLMPALAPRLARMRRAGPRAVPVALLLALLAPAGDALAADSTIATADSLAVVGADSLALAPADTVAAPPPPVDSNELVFAPSAERRTHVDGWTRPLWDPFFATLRENLLYRTAWLPIQDGGLGAPMVVVNEPSTSPQPVITRDGLPLGVGHRYIDDMDAVAITGQILARADHGLDPHGGLTGTVVMQPYDPVPDRDLADTRWYKGDHETYLRDLHLLTADAPWRATFDFQEVLDDEGYDFAVPGDTRYPTGDTFAYWGHAKFRSGRGALRRDLGEAGSVAISLENVRKLKKGLPAYGLSHQDLWVNRASVDWRGRADATPVRVALWWTDTDVHWNRAYPGFRHQEAARTGALASWGHQDDHGRLDATWGRWTLVDDGAESWALADTGAVRLRGEFASLKGTRSWALGPARATAEAGAWWDEHGGWLAGGAVQAVEDRPRPRWSLRLERGGRAPRSDELATAWRFGVPGGGQTVALPERDLEREREWRLSAGVKQRLLGFDLGIDGAVRRLRHGIGWRRIDGPDGDAGAGRWDNGLSMDSATLRATIAREGRFLGWVRLWASGAVRTVNIDSDLAVAQPPSGDWEVTALWENHFFEEDGILQLGCTVHNRGAMDDPWHLAAATPLPAVTRVDAIAGFRLVGTNLGIEFLNLTGEQSQLTAGSRLHGFEYRWRLNWVFHY
jgi:hypothetical protein